jgi:hypothetical protein
MRTSLFVSWSLALVVAAATAACGGGDAQPVVPPAATDAPSAAPMASGAPMDSTAPTGAPMASTAPVASAAPVAPPAAVSTVWKDGMVKDDQIAFMKTNVVARMSKAFQDHDAKRYADAGCKTCHGPNFLPPKEFLPKLTMKGGKITAFAKKPDVAKFMAEKVVPEMAAAMGQQPYDPATKQGFGCGGCHTVEMK